MKSDSSTNPNILLQQAHALHQAGMLVEAEQKYKSFLLLNPRNPQALTGAGTIAFQRGNNDESLRLLRKSLEIMPDQLMALVNQANVLRKLGRFEEARASYDRIIALKPDSAEAHNSLGIVYKNLGRLNDAVASYSEAISISPRVSDAYVNRGNVLRRLGNLEKAKADFEKAIEINPKSAEAWNSLGMVFHAHNELEQALASYTQAISLKPGYSDAYNNRGKVLQDLHRIEEALKDYDQAIVLNPSYASPYWNKSLAMLLLGDFEEGWKLYEWRWKDSMKIHARGFSQPLWLGQQSLKAKRLLIYSEQGLGDFIQFCRYVPMCEALGAEVILEVPKELVALVKTLSASCTVIEEGEFLPPFDLYCPVMSLPFAFRTTMETIPKTIPYLCVDQIKSNFWQTTLGPKVRPRIGLVWSGSSIHNNNHNRNIPLQLFGTLFNEEFDFYSLQKEVRPQDIALLSRLGWIKNFQMDLKDFTDTAALISELDLVISVDTSVAHLAGALGKPVWILLPYAPDYRWMLDRRNSPWYPTASLFRQSSIGSWDSVLFEVRKELTKLN